MGGCNNYKKLSGYGRSSKGEFHHFLSIAHGSLMEIETQIIISGRLTYLENQQAKKAWDLIRQVSKMIYSLKKSLKSDA